MTHLATSNLRILSENTCFRKFEVAIFPYSSINLLDICVICVFYNLPLNSYYYFSKGKNLTWIVLDCFLDAIQLWYILLSRQDPEHFCTKIWSGCNVEPRRKSFGSCKYSMVGLGSQAGLALLAAWTSLAWHCLKTSKNVRNLQFTF